MEGTWHGQLSAGRERERVAVAHESWERSWLHHLTRRGVSGSHSSCDSFRGGKTSGDARRKYRSMTRVTTKGDRRRLEAAVANLHTARGALRAREIKLSVECARCAGQQASSQALANRPLESRFHLRTREAVGVDR